MMPYAEFRKLVAETLDAQARHFRHKDNLEQCKALDRRLRYELAEVPAQPGLFDAPKEPRA